MDQNTIDDNLRRVIEFCYEMLELADHGDKFRQDSGCGVVYGTLRDEAYKIRQLAEKELTEHRKKSGRGVRNTVSDPRGDYTSNHRTPETGQDEERLSV